MAHAPSALLLTTRGDVVEIDLPGHDRDNLTVMYAVLRCREVDCVRVTTGIDMWIDGEFLYNYPDEPNTPATAFLNQFGPVAQMIQGPVLITGGVGGEGETLPLTRGKLLAVLTKLADDEERLREMFRNRRGEG